ncbi:HCP-like protein [Amylostereum chailletii]|nr:HCP-like protein [Amylostereum chailletii]
MDGGSGFGMLMWGLTLRHGWGCVADAKQGFAWLRRAAEAAVGDLEGLRNQMGMLGAGGGTEGGDKSAVKAELVLAIYEVGQCFLQGWGVKKDPKMAVVSLFVAVAVVRWAHKYTQSYFRVAARLGDADAQQELGFCLANGRGCKKDRKEAAKWYRAAVAQGVSDIGLAWIYKEKFQ